jgi:hypothetical protein
MPVTLPGAWRDTMGVALADQAAARMAVMVVRCMLRYRVVF